MVRGEALWATVGYGELINYCAQRLILAMTA
jgi:hypothetical protein